TGRFADLTIGDRTANAMLVTYQEEPLLLIPQGSDLAAQFTPTGADVDIRWQTLLPLAVILGCGDDGLVAPTPVWQRTVSCISGIGGMRGWLPSRSRFGAQRSTPLDSDECGVIAGWAERLELRFDERHLGVAARRITRAVAAELDLEA